MLMNNKQYSCIKSAMIPMNILMSLISVKNDVLHIM